MEIPDEINKSEAFKTLSAEYILSYNVASFDQLPEAVQLDVAFKGAESLLQNTLALVQGAREENQKNL